MDILIEWVSQIIIFLLLASVVDLLMPSTSMKKYVKLTVGLILVLIFLKPVFHVFNMDVRGALEQSFQQVEEKQEETSVTESSIKSQKKEIQASQHAYILEEMAVQLKKEANTPLKQKYEQEAAHIDLQMSQTQDLTNENIEENLEQITVTLQATSEKEGVEAVEDISINTDEPSEDKTENASLDVQGIKKLLSDVWEIDKEKITIVAEGGSS